MTFRISILGKQTSEKENGDYLEFEIYEDRIEFFSISQKGEEQEETFLGKSAAERMKQMVVDFYG